MATEIKVFLAPLIMVKTSNHPFFYEWMINWEEDKISIHRWDFINRVWTCLGEHTDGLIWRTLQQ